MKHPLSRAVLVAAFLLALVAALPALGVTSTTPVSADDLANMALLGFEAAPWMAPDLVPAPSGILDCSQLNDSYCTYRYNKFDWCCDVVWRAPGAYCPRVCI